MPDRNFCCFILDFRAQRIIHLRVIINDGPQTHVKTFAQVDPYFLFEKRFHLRFDTHYFIIIHGDCWGAKGKECICDAEEGAISSQLVV
jgi:hypothetical protein